MLVNLTPHAVVILARDDNGQLAGTVGYGEDRVSQYFRVLIEIPSTGVARAKISVARLGEVEINEEKLPVTKTSFEELENLPTPDGETVYIVSLITAQAAKEAGRTTDDLLIVGETVRDAKGRILGCISFGRV